MTLTEYFTRFSKPAGSGAPNSRLIVFTRYPCAGASKTRLIPLLGPQGAADLHRDMTVHTVSTARRACAWSNCTLEVHGVGAERAAFENWLGADVGYCDQGEGDLGSRMNHAFNRSFSAGTRSAVVIGADCPGLTSQMLGQAFSLLQNHDVVLGPALDGGYYLIGLRAPRPALFESIPWGTNSVYDRTCTIAERGGLTVAALGELPDVDRPEDLPVWKEMVHQASARQNHSLSVIIPTLNEQSALPTTLACAKDPGVQVIVVDGGSSDATVTLAATYGAEVITSERGRAKQMNAGARAASGETLLFLHADTVLPEGFSKSVQAALDEPDIVAGAFRLGIAATGPVYRWIERRANRRALRRGMPYGDQCLFLKRCLFDQMGGFPEIPIMEDYEFMRRLNARGRVALLDETVTTSARRWQSAGPITLTLVHQAIIIGYRCGIPPIRLARWRRGR